MKTDNDTFQFSNLGGLRELRGKAEKPTEDTLRTAAKQLEAVFLQMVMKSMREANESFKSELMGSKTQDFYQDFYDQQMALHMSKNQGVGLSEIIFQQLKPHVQSEPEVVSNSDLKIQRSMVDNFATVDGVKNVIPKGADSESPKVENEDAKVVKTKVLESFKGPEDFINRLGPIVSSVLEGIGLNPSFVIAQAALETGWGKYIIEDQNGDSSHNLFNIKAHGWDGPNIKKPTLEYVSGAVVKEQEPFRQYESIQKSVEDFVKLLQSPRYEGALAHRDNPEAFFGAIHQSGYATDPSYVTKVLNVLKHPLLEGLR